MSEKVSESRTGQNEPKPTREERDAAFSSGAGRKAEEREKPSEMKAPIGTELETKGDDEAHTHR
jgi:hypothetical protein